MKQGISRLWWRARRKLGLPGLLGLLLLLPALGLGLWLPVLNRQADDLRGELAAQVTASTRAGPASPRTRSGREQAVEFAATFPALSQSASDLGEVFAIAQRRNLALPKGDYQLKAEPNAPLVAYTLTVPVSKDYAAIKGFVADVLEALPHVSLDELRLSRPNAGTAELEALVRLTFVYRSP
jgi:hypothetical protein